MLLRCATVRYPSTERSKCSSCTVNSSKYGKENQGLHFHHHCQACLIHHFVAEQTSLLMHVIQRNPGQSRIFYKPGKICLTRTKCDPVSPYNPDFLSISLSHQGPARKPNDPTRFQPWMQHAFFDPRD